MNNNMSKKDLMMMIQQYSFAMVECALFLDTHPSNTEALEYCEKIKDMLGAYTDEYERKYGPLTVFGADADKSWSWVSTPWPWEISE